MKNLLDEAPALRILHAAGMEAAGLCYEYQERGGTRDAAQKLRVEEHLVIKSLVFDNGREGEERRAVMALTHGDTRVSMHRLERLSGIRRLLPSSPETALELTGYMPGGICPFNLRLPCPCLRSRRCSSCRWCTSMPGCAAWWRPCGPLP